MKYKAHTPLTLFDWLWRNTDQLHTWKAGDALVSEADQAVYVCTKDHPIGIRDFEMASRATKIELGS
jgi:hypothetical protein